MPFFLDSLQWIIPEFLCIRCQYSLYPPKVSNNRPKQRQIARYPSKVVPNPTKAPALGSLLLCSTAGFNQPPFPRKPPLNPFLPFPHRKLEKPIDNHLTRPLVARLIPVQYVQIRLSSPISKSFAPTIADLRRRQTKNVT